MSCGSCWIFAAFAAAETALIKAGADLESMDLSESWALDCIMHQTSYGCGGGVSRDVAQFLVSRGVLVRVRSFVSSPFTKCTQVLNWSE